MLMNRIFNGRLNYDDDPFRLPQGDYIDALNITRDAQGVGKDEVVSNILGNTLVDFALHSGTNKVIGNHADKTRNRVYFFVWNSLNYHFILYYNDVTDTVVKVLANLTDTGNVDILGFNPSYRINHVDIIYRDTEGDLLFWTDGLNPPSKINVLTAESGGYGTVLRSYIDVAKEPASAPPYCVYENDATVTKNNLNKLLFKFKIRWIFDDLEKSVTSSQSEIPIPYFPTPQSSSDPTLNADIFLVYQTGTPRVKKIQILGAVSIGNEFSDFFLIEELDKSTNSIPDNDVSTYRFYNNKAYTNIDIEESIQDYDRVPFIAGAQCLPNGDVLDYSNITEGYDHVPISMSVDVSGNALANQRIQTVLLTATQSAVPAFGSGNIRIIVAGIVLLGSQYSIITSSGNIFYTSILGDTVASVLSGISASAVGLGFTQISLTSNNLIIFKSATTLNLKAAYSFAPNSYAVANSVPAYDWNSNYDYGLVYFDTKGRTNGQISPLGALFTTHKYAESGGIPLLPTNILSINHRPPVWATYFHIVRTKNLSKSTLLQWVTDRTFKDSVSNNAGYKYAYVSIANLTQYIIDNPQAKANLGYEFLPGDRIKFIKLYNGDGTTAQIYDGNDFEIQESLTDPIINGTQTQGQILKLVLPSNISASFDFGGNAFANYMIELYTPALNFSPNATLYYEFGERYIVINAGLATRYHQGMTQNQSSNLSQPALYEFTKGDDYALYRQVESAGIMKFVVTPAASISNQPFFFGNTLTVNTVNTTEYTPQSNSESYTRSNTNYNIIKPTVRTIIFRVRGSFTVKSNVNSSVARLVVFTGLPPGSGGVATNTTIVNLTPLTANVEATFTFDTLVTFLDVEQYWWFYTAAFSGEIVRGELIVTEANKIIFQEFISQNVSDFYDSAVNSNGRPWVYDPNAGQSVNPVLNRFSQTFQSGTTINNLNRFYYNNRDVWDRSNGVVRKMFIEGRMLYVFQEFDVGVVTILTQLVKDTAGNPLSADSDKLLNKITYPYVGKFGIGNIPESFAYSKNAKYFVDNNKGVVCRLSLDGEIPVSVQRKMNAFFVDKLSGFRTDLNTPAPATGTPTVYGTFDNYTNKYIVALSAISRSGLTQDAYTLCFLESRNESEGFESPYSYHPENIGCLNNLLVTFNAGKIWKHNSTVYCNFYGVQYDAFIVAVFNDNTAMEKSFLQVEQYANTKWDCPEITTQSLSYGSTVQLSSLPAARFGYLEGKYSSVLLRDSNSRGGVINGDSLKGGYIIIKFRVQNAASFVLLNGVSVYCIDSPLNIR